jgi:hypothetical protein
MPPAHKSLTVKMFPVLTDNCIIPASSLDNRGFFGILDLVVLEIRVAMGENVAHTHSQANCGQTVSHPAF